MKFLLLFLCFGITPDFVCKLQNSLNKGSTWNKSTCEIVSEKINTSSTPYSILAIQILESRMQEDAENKVSPGISDVGLMQLRCRYDVNRICTNSVVKGYTVDELKDLQLNLELAFKLIDEKKRIFGRRWLAGYNGSLHNAHYELKVKSTIRALKGKRPFHTTSRKTLIHKIWQLSTEPVS